MKELSIEQKAKAYDEAIKRAKDFIKGEVHYALRKGENIMCWVFPELKESEDERIRKALMQNLKERFGTKGNMGEGLDMPDVLAWLEKQGEQKAHTLEQAANIFLDALSNTPYNNKPITDAQVITKELLKFLSDARSYNPNAINKQNPADKVEQKFKIGEWITNGDYTWQIVNVTDLDYILKSQNGHIVYDTISHVDEQFHSFIIEDAKDGDVLYECNEKKPFIFKELKHIDDITSYCDIFNGIFNPNEDSWTTWDIVPATKEQREQLERVMLNAGYRWNKEKLKLEKYE